MPIDGSDPQDLQHILPEEATEEKIHPPQPELPDTPPVFAGPDAPPGSDDEDTDKRPAIIPPPSTRILSERQARAFRYLERKETRRERSNADVSTSNHQIPASLNEEATVEPVASPARNNGYSGLREVAGHRIPPRHRVSAHQGRQARMLEAKRRKTLLVRYLSRKRMRLSREDSHRSFARFWIVLLSTVTAIVVLFLTITAGGSYAAYSFYTQTQAAYASKVLTLQSLVPKDNLKMYDMNGILIGQLTDNGIHTSVPLNQISPWLQKATVSTEDKDFWTNPGIDVERIIESAIQDLGSGRIVAGGSTITQQLIKNLVLGNQDQDILRKLQEIALTPDLNSHYSKASLLEMYLNSINYGEETYSADSAATVYFGLEDQPGRSAASQLDLAQAAMLAGIPNSPTLYNPLINPEPAFGRFVTVLDLMVKNGYITDQQRVAAIQEEQSPNFFQAPASLINRAPHFFNLVLGQLEQQFKMTHQQLSRSDMKVYTTLDITLQDKILQIAQQHIASLANYHVTNAAEVLIDYHSGAIRTLLGSVDYYSKTIDGEYDVTQAYRQPGSSFKPYVYVTAFADGYSPGQAIDDAPLSIKLPPGSTPATFSPTNYFNNYNGHMTLRCALQNSLNVPAVKVLQHVGINSAMQTAKAMGIESYVGTPGYSMVLGGLQITLLDHTSAYGTFADGGIHVPYYAIQKVVFVNSQKTYVHQQSQGTRAISPQLAYMMTNVLSDTQDRLPDFGYCNPLELHAGGGCTGPMIPAAAKTGTTNNFIDDWTVGYTSDYVLGVWAGNNDNTPTHEIDGIQGAAPLWHDAMLAAEQGHTPTGFTNPGGLVTATVTYPDGVHTTDLFLPGMQSKVPAAPTQNNGNNDGNAGNAHPMCPSFSYAFNPPAPMSPNAVAPANQGWW